MKIIIIILILFSTPCFSEDRIRAYTDEKGRTVYTNEHKAPQNNIPNNLKPQQLNGPFPAKYYTQKPEINNFPASSQPNSNINDIGNRIFMPFVAILAIPFLLLGAIFLLWLLALIDLLRHEFTGSNKIIWFLCITFLPLIGVILYFTMAERQKIITAANDNDAEIIPSPRKNYTPPDI